ncbi:EsaB/YukD family protein [Micromonospora sp. NPDC003197]
MANEQSRITVVGARRRVDIAVPSDAPIGEYAPRLAELCGQKETGVMPPAWSLAPAEDAAYPLDATLRDLRVVDGQVLYLRDLAQEPGDAPVVKDIDEVVADESAQQRRHRMHAGPAVLAFGLVWLLAATVLTAWRTGLGIGALAMLVVAGVTLLGTSWGLGQRQTAIPNGLLPVISLAAVPCFAVAGMFVADGLGGPDYRWAGIIVGANLATLMALAIGPNLVLMAVQFQLLVAAVLAFLLLGLDASGVEAAAAIAAVATGLLAAARRTAATVTAWGRERPRGRETAADATAQLVAQSGRILGVVMAGPAVALVVALPFLTLSGRGFAVAVAAVVTIALLARVRRPALTSELLLIGGAAIVGLFSLLHQLISMIGGSVALLTVLSLGSGLAVVGIGVALAVLVTGPGDDQPETPGGLIRPRKRSRADGIGMVAGIAIAPLTMGVFGVFSHLVMVGRTLF